jgi:transcriptional regulator with XRE-family HTH domain
VLKYPNAMGLQSEPSIDRAGEPRRWKVRVARWDCNHHSHYSARVFALSSGSPYRVMPQIFGDKLRLLRRQRGFTQTDLARDLGLATHSHVSYLERNRSAPSLDLVLRLADVFNVTTDYLLRDVIPADQPQASVASSQTAHTLSAHFSAKLRQLRTQQGTTQVELANQLGVTAQYISFLESGRKIPSIAIVLLCADLFGVSTDELLLGSA